MLLLQIVDCVSAGFSLCPYRVFLGRTGGVLSEESLKSDLFGVDEGLGDRGDRRFRKRSGGTSKSESLESDESLESLAFIMIVGRRSLSLTLSRSRKFPMR